jgi:hypothetical protein
MHATYSLEDNKLRLYPDGRLDPTTYGTLRAAGLHWAPTQQLFVAPMWTPEREDALLELVDEIDDEDVSLTERQEARAERARAFEARRLREAEASHDAAMRMARQMDGQPILIGHHSEKRHRRDTARMQALSERSTQLWRTSKYWAGRAQAAIEHGRNRLAPDVRRRRIKRLEADCRRYVASYTPVRGSTPIQQQRWSNGTHVGEPIPHVLVGQGVARHWVPEIDLATIEQRCSRWVAHLHARLVYEQEMLRAEGEALTVPARPRRALPPLLNYRSAAIATRNRWHSDRTLALAQIEMPKAEYARIHRDYKGCTAAADGSHRVRTTMRGGALVAVFLLDQREDASPATTGATAEGGAA